MYHTILWTQQALDLDKENPHAVTSLFKTEENLTLDRAEALDYLSYAMAMVSRHEITAWTVTIHEFAVARKAIECPDSCLDSC
jgi:hypothetical protein